VDQAHSESRVAITESFVDAEKMSEALANSYLSPHHLLLRFQNWVLGSEVMNWRYWEPQRYSSHSESKKEVEVIYSLLPRLMGQPMTVVE
jgi:hypothetical protein